MKLPYFKIKQNQGDQWVKTRLESRIFESNSKTLLNALFQTKYKI